MTPGIILVLLIVVLLLSFILEQALEFLNLRHQPAKVPAELADHYDQVSYQKALEYHRANTGFQSLSSGFGLLLWLAILATGFLGKLDGWLIDKLGTGWLQPLVFFGLLFLALDLLNLPFQLYQTFGIEARFGFNKTTPALFISDKLKGYVLSALIGGGLLALLLWLIRIMGPNFWLIFSLIAAVFIIFINVFYTSLILPLFNKLTPLEPGKLRDDLEHYASSQGFKLSNTFVMDNSKRSTKLNAFFSGLGPQKKVVLFDTLIDKMTTDEIVAVVAHEIGHYKRGHIPKTTLAAILNISLILFVLSLFIFSPKLSQALGTTALKTHLNLIAVFILFSPISQLIGILFNYVSRLFEYEADAFASKTSSPSAMISALKNLSVANLSTLVPHPLYVMVHYSHPPVIDRIRAILRH